MSPARVHVTADELSNVPLKIGDATIAPGETRSFDVEAGGLNIAQEPGATTAPATTSPTLPGATPDIFAEGDVNRPQHGNPNGITQAVIAPKIPKASGELSDIPAEGGRIVQRPVVGGEGTAGQSTQGGGPEAGPQGQTPGPKPADAPAAMTVGPHAAATGDTDARGKPLPLTAQTLETSAQGREGANEKSSRRTTRKAPAKKSSRR